MSVLEPPRRRRDQRARRKRGLLRLAAVVCLVVAGVAAVLFLVNGDSGDQNGSGSRAGGQDSSDPLPVEPPRVAPYRPSAGENLPVGKEFATRVAQQALTYARGDGPREISRSLGKFGAPVSPSTVRDGASPGSRSWARVVYPQLSGYTGDTMGAMVVVRQTTEDEDGERESVTRVVDVRLVLEGGEWRLDSLGSVGGSPAPRPPGLPSEAVRVLDDPRIDLPDTARWDIHRGRIDLSLLDALTTAAAEYPLRVAVLQTGHPPNVWATDRPSAHASGLAGDIWAVGGVPVVEQRATGTKAFSVASGLVEGGAVQVGSPWVFTTDGFTSFTDEVHQDHIHVQQSGG